MFPDFINKDQSFTCNWKIKRERERLWPRAQMAHESQESLVMPLWSSQHSPAQSLVCRGHTTSIPWFLEDRSKSKARECLWLRENSAHFHESICVSFFKNCDMTHGSRRNLDIKNNFRTNRLWNIRAGYKWGSGGSIYAGSFPQWNAWFRWSDAITGEMEVMSVQCIPASLLLPVSDSGHWPRVNLLIILGL